MYVQVINTAQIIKVGGAAGSQRQSYAAIWDSNGTTELVSERYSSGNNTDNIDLTAKTLIPGNTYYLSVDTYHGGYAGSFTLCLDSVPDYDDYEGAKNITALIGACSVDAAYTTQGASGDKNKGSCWNNNGPQYNRWFKFQAPASGQINVKVKIGGNKGTQRRTQIAIWESDGTREIACNHYEYNNEEVELSSTTLIPGHLYYISVDTYHSGYAGSFTICLDDEPTYDYFEGAIELTDLNNWCSVNKAYTSTGATPDKLKGSCWNNAGPKKNRWFKFKALTANVLISVKVGGAEGKQRRSQVALWESDGLSQRQCSRYTYNSDDITLTDNNLTVGNWYYISVDTYHGGYAGSFTLCIDNVDATYYSIANGNWNNNANWSLVGHSGPPAASYPNAGDIANIRGHQIAVSGNESCAEVKLVLADANTSLTIDNAVLEVKGKVSMENQGESYDGLIELKNNAHLSINDSLILKRKGGNQAFEFKAADNSSIAINKSLYLQSLGGAMNNNLIKLEDNASLKVNKDLNVEENAGIKSKITANANSKIEVLRDVIYRATSNDKIEVEMNNQSEFAIGGDFHLGTPAYGRMNFYDASIFIFNGTKRQNIPSFSGLGSTDRFSIPRIVLNNSFGGLPQYRLTDKLIIEKSLTFNRGVIEGNGHRLIFSENGLPIGDHGSSYVDGRVEIHGNDDAYFPTGDGQVWAPVELKNLSGNSSTVFSAQYFFKDYGNRAVKAPLNNASTLEYWDVENSGSPSTADLTLFFKNSNRSRINDFADLVVAHYNTVSNAWESMGVVSTWMFNPGSISVASVSTFSPFTFGSLDSSVNPLPIRLLRFEGKVLTDGTAQLIWETQTEINNDYFTLEHSVDGVYFEQVASIAGKGNSQIKTTYHVIDSSLVSGLNYYRLSQTDYNGSKESFAPIVLHYAAEKESLSEIDLYPNPNRGNAFNLVVNEELMKKYSVLKVYSMDRQLRYKTELIIHPGEAKPINLRKKLAKGVYFIELTNGPLQTFCKMIVQ